MSECSECSVDLGEKRGDTDHDVIISGSGIWCSSECWEAYHGQPYFG